VATRECQNQGNGGHLVGPCILIMASVELLLAASAKHMYHSQSKDGLTRL